MKNYKGKSLGKTFNPAGMDSAHLGKMTARRTTVKLSLKGKKALKDEWVKVSSLRTPWNGRSASGF